MQSTVLRKNAYIPFASDWSPDASILYYVSIKVCGKIFLEIYLNYTRAVHKQPKHISSIKMSIALIKSDLN